MNQSERIIKRINVTTASDDTPSKEYKFFRIQNKGEKKDSAGFICYNINRNDFSKSEKGFIFRQKIRSSGIQGWLIIILPRLDFKRLFEEKTIDCAFEGSEFKFDVRLAFLDSTLPIDQSWVFPHGECHFFLDYIDSKEASKAKEIKEKRSDEEKKRVQTTRESVRYNGFLYPKAFRRGELTQKHCPVCQTTLYDHYSILLTKECKQEIIQGKACRKCKCLYVENTDYIFEILKDNSFTTEYTLDGKYLWDYSIKKKKKERQKEIKEREKRAKEKLIAKQQLLESDEAAELMISIRYNDGKEEDILIVNSLHQANSLKNRLWYASENGREFLTAAFHVDRKKKGSIYGRKYTVLDVFHKNSSEETSYRILTEDIVIKKDGGLKSSIVDDNFQLVDVLLYSPFNDRYEVIKATADKENMDCFISGLLFRKFVNAYGNPGLDYVFGGNNRSFGKQFSELNAESILKEFGYTVSQNSRLSTKDRQMILAEMIDLDILPPGRILNYLDFFIQTHPAEYYNIARARWTEDFKFVSNYEANPARFLISQ